MSQEGRHARDRGDPLSANPYSEGSEEHETRAPGWKVPDGEIGHETAGSDGG